MGRNSVMPSMMPRMVTASQPGTGLGSRPARFFRWGRGNSGQAAETLLGVGDRRRPVHHGPGHVEHGVSMAGLVLESLRERSPPAVVPGGPEPLGHGLPGHLPGPRQAAAES